MVITTDGKISYDENYNNNDTTSKDYHVYNSENKNFFNSDTYLLMHK